MNHFKQMIAIIGVSFVCGLGFNFFSPHGIGVFYNPWSKNHRGHTTNPSDNNGQLLEEQPIIFVEFDRACQFIENQDFYFQVTHLFWLLDSDFSSPEII